MGATIVFPHYIGGKWVNPIGATVTRRSPRDAREIVGEVAVGTEQEAMIAIAHALKAQKPWAKVPAPQRARIIRRAVALLEQRIPEIVPIMMADAGKTKAGAEGELKKTVRILEWFDGCGTRLGGFMPAAEQQGVQTFSNPRPLGVVGIISPFNFPAAVPIWKIAPALVAGNTVVWKPSELTPATSNALMQVFIDAGLPAGVLNLVHGGPIVGKTIVEHPVVQAISFTGSTRVGMQIYADAARRGLDKVVCEMGGQNAVVVLADADVEKVAADIVTGAFGAAGQRCTATSRIIADRRIGKLLLDKVLELARTTAIPDWMGPLVSEEALGHVLARVQVARETDVQFCWGGNRITDGEYQHGCFMEPAIFVAGLGHFLWEEEVFGPVVAFHEVDGYDEAITALNANSYGHAASLYTNDLVLAHRFADDAEVGMVHVNEPTIGGEAHLGFGGMKATTVGPQEMGNNGLEFFSRRQTVSINWGGATISAGTR